jgi:hypothetical protein
MASHALIAPLAALCFPCLLTDIAACHTLIERWSHAAGHVDR